MPLVVLGINHRTAPVEIREKVVFASEELPAALLELRGLPGVREAVIVSTCNRTELYCDTEDGGAALADWVEHWHELASRSIRDCLYRHEGSAAVSHVFAVASGLDSMILGEPQILGQLKDAYRVAQQSGATGPFLNRLLQAAFAAAKRVRTETQVGANSVSVASAAVGLARSVFEKLEERTALLVGAGETIALTARHLHANGVRRMIIANRTLERATELATEFKASAVTLDALDVHLPEADILITSTASPTAIVSVDAVRRAIRARKRRPMFMVDIAVPRNIEPRVAKLEDVYLFTIDDLQNIITENLETRRAAAREADRLIENEVRQFEERIRKLDAVPAIRLLRADAEALRDQTLEQARRMLARGVEPRAALEFLATTLTNRLTHSPNQRLLDAAAHGEAELIKAAEDLFARHEPEE